MSSVFWILYFWANGLQVGATAGPRNYSTCRVTLLGQEYTGTLSYTITMLLCQEWSAQTPHSHTLTDPALFPDSSVQAANNYCRNPDRQPGGPWCFTSSHRIRWQYCEVPICPFEVAQRTTPRQITATADDKEIRRTPVEVTTAVTTTNWFTTWPSTGAEGHTTSVPDTRGTKKSDLPAEKATHPEEEPNIHVHGSNTADTVAEVSSTSSSSVEDEKTFFTSMSFTSIVSRATDRGGTSHLNDVTNAVTSSMDGLSSDDISSNIGEVANQKRNTKAGNLVESSTESIESPAVSSSRQTISVQLCNHDAGCVKPWKLELWVWTPWTACQPCGKGHQTRLRVCSLPVLHCTHTLTTRHNTTYYYEVHRRTCSIPVTCTTDCQWSLWTQWSTCTYSCGVGTTTRTRVCLGNNHGGKMCPGSSAQHMLCNTNLCPHTGLSPEGLPNIVTRREELLPQKVFTDADQETSNHIISCLAIAILLIAISTFVVPDLIRLIKYLGKTSSVK